MWLLTRNKLAVKISKEMRHKIAYWPATEMGGEGDQVVYDPPALYFYYLQKDDYCDKKT